MSEPMNVEKAPGLIKTDLITRQGRVAALGWVAFFIVLLVLVVQTLFIALRPKEVLASVDGKVVGQVVFDEARIRDNDAILADVKKWVERCSSLNKITIYEDLAVCLNHMDADLANERVTSYQKNNYASTIAKIGCTRTDIEFDTSTTLERDNLGYQIVAVVEGRNICIIPGQKPKSQAFKQQIFAKLVNRDTNRPLGLIVSKFADI